MSFFLILLLYSGALLAYIDPASGSAIISAVIGIFVAIWMTIKTYWYKLKSALSKLYAKKKKKKKKSNILKKLFLIDFFKKLFLLPSLQGISSDPNTLVFYSEGANYWTHFKDLILSILKLSNLKIIFLTSDEKDPGLVLQHENFTSFNIGDGHVRTWIFKNLKASFFVMTTPDIGTYHLKKSIHDTHYIYIPHSMVSLHMSYGSNAFDAFDTVFCTGQYQVEELKEIKKVNNLQKIEFFEFGYPRLDSLLKLEDDKNQKKQNILFAPSWGLEGVIESGKALGIIEQLILEEMPVTLRPHPQTIRYASDKLKVIKDKFADKPSLFKYEENVSDSFSIMNCSALISDWGGTALEFSLATNKPIVLLDTPTKIINSSFKEFKLSPIEIRIRNILGTLVSLNQNDIGKEIVNIINNNKFNVKRLDLLSEVFNVGQSAEKGAKHLIDLVNKKNNQ